MSHHFIVQVKGGRNRKCTFGCAKCRAEIDPNSDAKYYIKNDSTVLVFFCHPCIVHMDEIDNDEASNNYKQVTKLSSFNNSWN